MSHSSPLAVACSCFWSTPALQDCGLPSQMLTFQEPDSARSRVADTASATVDDMSAHFFMSNCDFYDDVQLTAATGRALNRSKNQKAAGGLNAEQSVGPVHGTIGKASLDGPLPLVNGPTRPFSPAPERRSCMPKRVSVPPCMLLELARRGGIESSASLRHGGPVSQSRSAR